MHSLRTNSSLPLVQAVTVKSRFLKPNFQPSDNLNKTNFLSTVKHCNFDHFSRRFERSGLTFLVFSLFFEQVFPVRLATCSLHSSESSSGMSLFVQTIKLRQFVCTPWPENSRVTLGEARRPLTLVENSAWLEAAVVQLGPIVTDISAATSKPELHLEQKDFLEMHDAKFQRLWFLWQPQDQLPGKLHGVCGCTGGCNFFGKNVNGPRFFTAEKLDASENDTGMDGFGSETGFYDDGDIVDSGARPLMYSRSADLNALESNYFDRTPVGSIEAFTRRRYTASGSEGSSPKVRRSMQTQTNKEAYIDLGIGKKTHLLFLTR